LRFHEVLSDLRYRSGKRQRQVAADLGISQALLSHYENGTREPGLAFLVRACDYYGVTADYLLGRTQTKTTATGEEAAALAQQLRALADKLTGLGE
jgi:transcriptional regulator with XRE-family HTH domain